MNLYLRLFCSISLFFHVFQVLDHFRRDYIPSQPYRNRYYFCQYASIHLDKYQKFVKKDTSSNTFSILHIQYTIWKICKPLHNQHELKIVYSPQNWHTCSIRDLRILENGDHTSICSPYPKTIHILLKSDVMKTWNVMLDRILHIWGKEFKEIWIGINDLPEKAMSRFTRNSKAIRNLLRKRYMVTAFQKIFNVLKWYRSWTVVLCWVFRLGHGVKNKLTSFQVWKILFPLKIYFR